MIQESSVLLRVEHLKESTGRVTVDSLTNLVDFIDEDQRVLDSDALECLYDLPWQGPVDIWTSEQTSMHRSGPRHTRHRSFGDP